MLEQYIKEIKRQMTDDRDLFVRDPFGNLNHIYGVDDYVHRRRVDMGIIYHVNELTGGTEGYEYNEHGQPIGGD